VDHPPASPMGRDAAPIEGNKSICLYARQVGKGWQRDEAVDDETDVAAAIEAGAGRAGALLPVLHALQERIGHVPPGAVPRIAQALNLSRAEVQGVLSFYSDFRDTPAARHVLRLCMAEACLSQGATALQELVSRRLGIGAHQRTPDDAVELIPVYCLGNCACAPALTLDGRLHGRMSVARLDALLGELGQPS
jgi:formate dehydrogenase subunit gamma